MAKTYSRVVEGLSRGNDGVSLSSGEVGGGDGARTVIVRSDGLLETGQENTVALTAAGRAAVGVRDIDGRSHSSIARSQVGRWEGSEGGSRAVGAASKEGSDQALNACGGQGSVLSDLGSQKGQQKPSERKESLTNGLYSLI